MLRLYDYLESGNGYKVRLLLHQLGLPFERVELDIVKGETRTPAFLAKNPNGRIPTLELEDGIPARSLVLSGTPGGVIFQPTNVWRGSLYLKPGDEVVARANGLGALQSRVAP